MDGSRIRKEKVADSKISGYVWTGPNFDVCYGEILGFGVKKKKKKKEKRGGGGGGGGVV